MAEPHPDPVPRRGQKGSRRKRSKTEEFLQRLDHISTAHPPARLLVDLARDAALEAYRKKAEKSRRLAADLDRMRRKRDVLNNRLVAVLHELTTGTVLLPRPPGPPPVDHDALLAAFRRLRSTEFPALAQTLHDRAGRADVAAFQRFLVDEILIKGSRIVVEHLLRHAGQTDGGVEMRFREQIRDHIAGHVDQGLARKVGYQMTADVGRDRNVLIERSIAFLTDLLTAAPPGRLLAPLPEDPFDPLRHEATPGRPAEGNVQVLATLFPGYLIREDPDRVVEKALVFTAYLEDAEE
jgi:hypothetical protein